MGTRGPIGKRDDERVRRNKPEDPTATVSVIGTVEIPELGDISFFGETHPIVEDMYQSIKDSAAVKFYEPTDWQFARLTLYTLNEELLAARAQGRPIGAMKLTAINQMMSSLLLTEGDRRRARIEIERAPGADNGENVREVSDLFAERLGLAQ
ncbi:terminase small subunit [Gordonia phage Nedarya]|nr:terminase small subunit [Gordonia phage Nedarya]